MEAYFLDVQFQEAYKRLDALCKDCYSAEQGVSEYIRQMEKTPMFSCRNIPAWEYDLRMLKHVRYIRNELAHEVDTWGTGLCTEDDLEFVTAFHQKILGGTDPLSELRKLQTQQTPRRPAANVDRNERSGFDEPYGTIMGGIDYEDADDFYGRTPREAAAPSPKSPKKLTLWQRFVRSIKKLFRR